MHVWFCRVVCLRACLLVYQLVCRFVGLLAPCFSFCAMLTMLVTFFCACLCGWVPKDCTNYHMWVPFWGPIGGNLFSHLMLRVSVGWTLRMNTSNSCCSLSPILSRYIPCISTLGCAVKIFHSFNQPSHIWMVHSHKNDRIGDDLLTFQGVSQRSIRLRRFDSHLVGQLLRAIALRWWNSEDFIAIDEHSNNTKRDWTNKNVRIQPARTGFQFEQPKCGQLFGLRNHL